MTNTGHVMGVQSDVPRDCRTFKLYASGCECQFLLRVCFFCCSKSQIKSRCNNTGLNCYVEFCECSSFYWARTLVAERGCLFFGV